MCIRTGWGIGAEPAGHVKSAYLQGRERKNGARAMINNEGNLSFHVTRDYYQSQGEPLAQSKSRGTFSTSMWACFIRGPRCSNQLRSDRRAAIRVRAQVRGRDIAYRFLRGSGTGARRGRRRTRGAHGSAFISIKNPGVRGSSLFHSLSWWIGPRRVQTGDPRQRASEDGT